MPEHILMMDDKLSHHTIVVDKSTHQLFVYENKNSQPVLLKTYSVATGKYTGDKQVQGDKKTPEGIYTFQQFISSKELIRKYGNEGRIYGAGAFTLNYPNFFDRKSQKTGGGIWLHSTNDNSRISKGLDSRGCVVAVDEDLFDISQYIEMGKSTIIITQEQKFLTLESWQKQKREIKDLLNQWRTAWQNKDIKNYLNFYHKTEYADNFRKNYREFKNYKSKVFQKKGKITVTLSAPSIHREKNQLRIQFLQTYESSTINDTGLKTLFLTQDKRYHWKIVNETWTKYTEQENIAFSPSQRYFKDLVLN